MTKIKTKYDVGIIVGRFQVSNLHKAHTELIQEVINNHHRTILFLGLSPLKCTINNPLDFESRSQMISEIFPNITIAYITDMKYDVAWSNELDKQIKNLVGPTSTVLLYGGRSSFIDCYKGRYDTMELQQTHFVSGTRIRNNLSKTTTSTPDFRSGVIWATQNKFINAVPVVDIAILNEDETQVLLCRKDYEPLFMFLGGFVDPRENYEQTAKRECLEEAHVKIGELVYIGTTIIDDWRYRGEKTNITTLFYKTKIESGLPIPDDDIIELKWFKISEGIQIVKPHEDLLQLLLNNLK